MQSLKYILVFVCAIYFGLILLKSMNKCIYIYIAKEKSLLKVIQLFKTFFVMLNRQNVCNNNFLFSFIFQF